MVYNIKTLKKNIYINNIYLKHVILTCAITLIEGTFKAHKPSLINLLYSGSDHGIIELLECSLSLLLHSREICPFLKRVVCGRALIR
jgi:hypothetical protein